MLFKKKCKVYTFKEFFDEEKLYKFDKYIGDFVSNKDNQKKLVFSLVIILSTNPYVVFADDKVVPIGYEIIRKIQLYAGIMAMIMAVIELSGELIKGGRNHFQIIFKYGVGYISLLMVPTVFETIRNLF